MQKKYTKRVFCHNQCRGNTAEVVVCNNGAEFSDDDFLKTAARYQQPATAFIWPVESADSGLSYFIRWFSPHGEIKFCGHGSLAATDVILSQLHQGQNELNLLYTDGKIFIKKIDDNQYVLALDAIELLPVQLTLSIRETFNQPAVNSLQSEPSDGYLILQLPDKAAVESFDFDDNKYCRISERALIVTARCESDASTIYFRYFAPQYGAKEDTATGSAAPVLAAYWQIKPQTIYQCVQLSNEGGFYQLQVDQNKVYLIGAVD